MGNFRESNGKNEVDNSAYWSNLYSEWNEMEIIPLRLASENKNVNSAMASQSSKAPYEVTGNREMLYKMIVNIRHQFWPLVRY